MAPTTHVTCVFIQSTRIVSISELLHVAGTESHLYFYPYFTCIFTCILKCLFVLLIINVELSEHTCVAPTHPSLPAWGATYQLYLCLFGVLKWAYCVCFWRLGIQLVSE